MLIQDNCTISDGFEFVTFKTNREDHGMSYRIAIDKDEIIESALAVHEKAYHKIHTKPE